MTQVGINLGPRHARVLGWAKSFTKSLDKNMRFIHDRDAVAAASISWSLFQAAMPQEIISPVYDALSEAGLPRIATRDVEPGIFLSFSLTQFSLTHPTTGKGFSLGFGDHLLVFPNAERAPPESYFAAGYEV